MKLDFFKTKLSAEDQARLDAAQTTINALETERDTLKADLATANAAIAKHGDAIAAANKLATDAQAEVVTVKAQALADVEVAKASAKTLAAHMALEIAGKQVTDPIPAEKPNATKEKSWTERAKEAAASAKK